MNAYRLLGVGPYKVEGWTLTLQQEVIIYGEGTACTKGKQGKGEKVEGSQRPISESKVHQNHLSTGLPTSLQAKPHYMVSVQPIPIIG